MKTSQFDTEVEQYREHLEEVYALCLPCKTQVKRTLTLQDSLLRPHLVGHTVPTRWRVLAYYCLPWKQRLRLILSTMASVLSLCASMMFLMTLLKNDTVLARYASKMGLASLTVNLPPMQLLHPAGLVLSGSSVLLAGRRRLGLTALLLCFLWLQLVALHHFEVGKWLNTFYMSWSQLVLACATLILAVAHTFTLVKIQLRGGALRKLVGPSGSSLSSSPCASSGASLSSAEYLANWEEGSQYIGQSDFGDKRSTFSRRTKSSLSSTPLADLSDKISDVHISPESERSWTTSTWSKPTSLQGASEGGGILSGTNACGMPGGKPSSLLWPARLRLQQGSSWMAGGMWALGGTRTPSDTQILWGVRQRFGLLTPPPSDAGSAKHSSNSSNAGQTQQKDWVFFKERDAFFSSSPDGRFISDMRTPASAASPLSGHRLFNGQRSSASAPRMNGAPTLRQCTSRGAMSSPVHNTQSGGYAKSSVSQTSLATGKSVASRPAAASSEHFLKRPFPHLSWLLLGLSMVLNASLFAYYFVFSSRVTVMGQ
ncbi:hypothetical protein V5799_028017 [Amblyomma americanum]|uniref:Uncharacterized protein n=1 Tax=Amblyomma americanum TaxID=6943 RepID=A0AAQ4DE27_AMBAM